MKKLIKRDSSLIRVFEPKTTIQDKFQVMKTLFNNNLSGTSPVVSDFEKKAAEKFGRKYAIAVSNGSVALDVAFQSLNLEKNDEVILPSHTIISCLSAVVRSGATPIFCDVDSINWNMTLKNIEEKISSRTKAVLMVHTFGLPSQAKEIKKFCEERNIILIEDTAEAHGQQYDSQLCGTFGEISTFSFYANKHITTGEGGMLMTDSLKLYNQFKQIRNLDFTNENRFQHNNLFWNYRLSGLQASLGISQLNNLEKVIRLKRKQGTYYQKLFMDFSELLSTQADSAYDVKNHYWVFGILLKKENIRNNLMKLLLDEGIETRPFFWPLHLQNALPDNFKNSSELLPVSVNLGKNGLYIPIGPHINKKNQRFIVRSLIKHIKTI
tara:strand:+ start:20697 stop:21839 length:1143 start_codon:yes stop_codon:yes gene_type:complete